MKNFIESLSLTLFLVLASLFTGCSSSRQLKSEDQTPAVRSPLARPAPVTALGVSPHPALKAGLDALIPDSLFPPASVGIEILSLRTGEVLYDLNAHSLFNPASDQKLFTAAAALAELGEGFPLATTASIDTTTSTICVKGFGDPLFSTKNMDSLAGLVRSALPPGKTWRVAGDVSYFDNEYWGYGWDWDDEPEAYQMYLTPLILNGNSIRLIVKPGKRIGGKLIATIEPPTAFVTIENQGTTVLDSIALPLKLSRKWRERLNVLTIEGNMRVQDTAGESYDFSVWQPERYAVQVFAEHLRMHGVIVYETTIDTLSPAAFEVARISHPLDSVVTYMNKVSDNLSGETLLKVLGAERKARPGTAAAGGTVVKEFLAEKGVDTMMMRIADGSGLSRMNLASPDQTVRLLKAMYDSSHFPSYFQSLPIAGIDGTIRSRMKRTAAQNNLRAKTGSLTGVTTLSGYVQTADSEWLAFSIMMMNYPGDSQAYRQVQDRIGVYLSGLRKADF